LVTVSPEFAGSTPTGTVTVKASATTLCTIKLSSGRGACGLTTSGCCRGPAVRDLRMRAFPEG